MTSPRAPRDPRAQAFPGQASPGQASPVQASPAAAPDLAPGERALAARFSALARAQAPASLARRCLEAHPGARVADPVAARPTSGGVLELLRAPLSWAAGVLLAVGVAGLGGSQGPLSLAPASTPEPVTTVSLRVVDDPSVSLFHAVETFDRLTPAPLVAWNGSSASPAEHGDSDGGR